MQGGPVALDDKSEPAPVPTVEVEIATEDALSEEEVETTEINEPIVEE